MGVDRELHVWMENYMYGWMHCHKNKLLERNYIHVYTIYRQMGVIVHYI